MDAGDNDDDDEDIGSISLAKMTEVMITVPGIVTLTCGRMCALEERKYKVPPFDQYAYTGCPVG